MVLFIFGGERTGITNLSENKKELSCKYKQLNMRYKGKESDNGIEDIRSILVSFLKYFFYFPVL